MKNYFKALLLLLFISSCAPEELEQFYFTLTTDVFPKDAGALKPNSSNFPAGILANLEAVPSEHYAFKGWYDASRSILLNENISALIIMNAHQHVTAVFELKDTDNDGVTDDIDNCADTPDGEDVNENGCSDSQKDTDEDGVMDDADTCPDTPAGEDVDENGCSDSQRDTDEDGVMDDADTCPDTPAGEVVNEEGCQLTYVPDDNFENFLETHTPKTGPGPHNLVNVGDENSMGDGIEGNDYVLTSRIENLLTLIIEDEDIEDLTGIEDFLALKYLDLEDNPLTSLDLSHNLALEGLDCSYTYTLTSLNVSQNKALLWLDCRSGALTSLDVSQNTALEILYCGNNNLTSLDVRELTVLRQLHCYRNDLTSLDVSKNIALEELYCDGNDITCFILVNELSDRSGWEKDDDPEYSTTVLECNGPPDNVPND